MFLSHTITPIDWQWLPLTGSVAKGSHLLALWGAGQDKVMAHGQGTYYP